MLYFFRRGDAAMSLETRLDPDGPGYQLVITEQGAMRVENIAELQDLLGREHELLQGWRAQGWRDVGHPASTPANTWSGPR